MLKLAVQHVCCHALSASRGLSIAVLRKTTGSHDNAAAPRMQRAMGEFGAVSVISGNIIGRTQTLTLYVESAYKEYNTEAAFSAAVLLSFLALATLFVKEALEQKSTE